MLTGYHIAVLGGDARQIEIIRKLNEWDATVYLAGFDQLNYSFTETVHFEMDEEIVQNLDAVLLPVSGTDDQGYIDGVFAKEKILIDADWLKRTPEHCRVFTGISNDYLNGICKEAGRELIPLMDRDDIAIYNSVPTVEGALMMVIQHTDFTIHASNIIILGLGRVGMTAARTFSAMGATIFVGVRKSADYARISEMGLSPFYLTELADHTGTCDVLINTIPVRVVTAEVIQQMPSHAFILDLASKPGGTDFRYAEKRGIKALLAPGLPGIVAPKSAGRILASVVLQLLLESKRKDDEQ
ncbi:dipicolinic acid synthetase subunit A [Thalassobacillus sp. CUG 92003]|uniref:dipicolinic acid synthetase subunit A n=1 Tax=Thalassobacillus sp. CUG 92003 TaxID=2736641 RepID=UPI0015E7D251|nr:dipicolinic acid synthetase subunit A [Thalassobacillus sp. CUG 92003]